MNECAGDWNGRGSWGSTALEVEGTLVKGPVKVLLASGAVFDPPRPSTRGFVEFRVDGCK